MTEKFKHKAEEYAINMWGNDEAFIDERNNCKQDYIAGATEIKELQEKKIAELEKENAEAKEIIRDLLIVYKQYNQTDTYIRAERFLKE